MTLTTGSVLESKYRLLDKLGEGGSGAVYLAENVRIGRRVAVKILKPVVATDAAMVERFEREARAAAQIGSAHIVEVLDSGEHDGCPYLVMEHLVGESLADRLEIERRMSPQGASLIAIQILDGLAKAHVAGIVHRDLKPENIFLVRKGTAEFVKILDFGVSKFEHAQNVTLGDSVLGTPAYMAPEQARGKRSALDHRADLYSVGVLLYECVSGALPFEGDSVQDLLFKVALEEPVALEERVPDIDPTFASLVRRALARSPAERFSTASEMADALRAWRCAVVGEEQDAEEMVRLALSMTADDWSSISAVRELRSRRTTLISGHSAPVRSLSSTVPPGVTPPRSLRRSALGKALAAGSMALLAAAGLLAARASLLSRAVPITQVVDALTARPAAAAPALPADAPATEPAGVPAPAPAPPSTAIEQLPSAPEPAAASPTIRLVHIETSPPGAAVLLEQGPLLCPRTPCDIELATRGEVRIALRRNGFEPTSRVLTQDDRSAVIQLRAWSKEAGWQKDPPSRKQADSPTGAPEKREASSQGDGYKPDPYSGSSLHADENPPY